MQDLLVPSLLRFHEVNNLLRWALARARVNIDRAGIEGYGTVRRGLQQIQSRTVYPQIFATVSSNLLLLFYSWRIKLKKKKKGRERERKGGEKSRPKRDRTRQSISRWSNKSKDRLLTTVFKSTERKKTQRESLSDLLRYPAIMDFRYFLLDSKRKLLLLPSTSHTVEWMNLELLTVWQRVTYTASSWVKVWNESTRYPVHDWNKTWGKKMMKRILSSHDRESKEIWKIETGSGPICCFLEQRESFRYPTDSL